MPKWPKDASPLYYHIICKHRATYCLYYSSAGTAAQKGSVLCFIVVQQIRKPHRQVF